MNIPTAEELFNKYSLLYQFEEGNPEYLIDKEDFKTALFEFATLHVQAALETVGDKIKSGFPIGGNIIKAGIKDAYPLTNIK